MSVAGLQTVPIEDAGDQIVLGDENKLSDRRDDIGRRAIALTAPALRQAHLAMGAADPMHSEHDLSRRIVDIGDDLLNERAYDALLQPRIGGRGGPDRPEVRRQRAERRWIDGGRRLCRIMRGDFGFDLRHMRQCLVPADLQFASHQPIGGVGGIVLSEGTVGGIARCFEVSAQHRAHLVPLLAGLLCSIGRSGDGTGADHAQERLLDGIVDAQSAKRNAL